MVAVGRALMSQPRLLMLDEPSLGIAPRLVAAILESLVEINRAGVAVFLVEQNVQAALTLAHRAYVLEAGRVVGGAPQTCSGIARPPRLPRARLRPRAPAGARWLQQLVLGLLIGGLYGWPRRGCRSSSAC